MTLKIKYFLFLNILGFTFLAYSQEDQNDLEEKKWKDKIEFGGYVKYMNTNQFRPVDTIYTDNLIHNRLNFKWFPNNNWTFNV